jgi:hypothetical protein
MPTGAVDDSLKFPRSNLPEIVRPSAFVTVTARRSDIRKRSLNGSNIRRPNVIQVKLDI